MYLTTNQFKSWVPSQKRVTKTRGDVASHVKDWDKEGQS